MRQIYLPLVIATLLLSGCSSKEYYSTPSTLNDIKLCQDAHNAYELALATNKISKPNRYKCTTGSRLVYTSASTAMLEDGSLLLKSSKDSAKIAPDSELLASDEKWLIYTNRENHLFFKSQTSEQVVEFEFDKTVASAAANDKVAVILFANNNIELYSLADKKRVFSLPNSAPTAIDNRIPAPKFLNSLALVATLDGKFVVIDSEKKELLRSTIISSERYFDNIFYLHIIKDTVVAATPHAIFVISDQESKAEYSLRDVIFNKSGIWITTKEGEVIHLDERLQVISSKKYPFAHFLAMIFKENKLYLLEKNGYLILLDKDLSDEQIYSVQIDDGYVFASDSAFYFDDKKIDIE